MKSLDSFTKKNLGLVLAMTFVSLVYFSYTLFFNGGIEVSYFLFFICLLITSGYLVRDFKEILLPLSVALLVGASFPNSLFISFGIVFVLSFSVLNLYKLRPRTNIETVFAQLVFMLGLNFPFHMSFDLFLNDLKIYLPLIIILFLVLGSFIYCLKGKSKRKHVPKWFSVMVGLIATIYMFFVSSSFLSEHLIELKQNNFNFVLTLEGFVDAIFMTFYLMMLVNSLIIGFILNLYVRLLGEMDPFDIGKIIEESAKNYFNDINGYGTNSFKVTLFGLAAFLLIVLDYTWFDLTNNKLIILFSMICFLLNISGDRIDKLWKKIK